MDVGYAENDNYHTKDFRMVYVTSKGYVYPNCKTYKTEPIGHLKDVDIADKVKRIVLKDSGRQKINMVTVELGMACQGNCLYCFQRWEDRKVSYPYYEDLEKFLCSIETNWLFFSGGEVLVQKDSMQFINGLRKKLQNVWFHLKTNANVDIEIAEFVIDNFDSVLISFSAFSEYSYKAITGLELNKVLQFTEKLLASDNLNVGVKLLLSPGVIFEVPKFYEWAFSIKPKFIVLQHVTNCEINGEKMEVNNTFDNLNSNYWNDLFGRVSVQVNALLRENLDKVDKKKFNLSMDTETCSILAIEDNVKEKIRTDGVYIIQ